MDFETSVAKVHWTPVDSRDATKIYNLITLAELAKRAPGFDFPALFAGAGANVPQVIVSQPSAVTGIASLIRKAPLGVLKDQLLVRSLDTYADYLPKAIDAENFAFYGTTLSGTPEQQVRWKARWTSHGGSPRRQRLRPALFPPETRRGRRMVNKRRARAANENRLDAPAPRLGPAPSSPPSPPRSAIPTAGATMRASSSAATI